jgi:anaerobic magnesium-protoporphyrin IX monomethyl ester cyclase
MAALLNTPAAGPRPPKVLLLRPPYAIYEQGFEKRIGVPIGIFSIAAVLEQEGVPVAIFDALVYDDSRDPRLWGASWDRMESMVRRWGPDIVGITNQFSQQRHLAVEAARRVKAIDPGIKTLIGGPHASARPADFLETGHFDLAVVGEGEGVILDILRHYQGRASLRDIPGLAWVEEGQLRSNPPRRIEDLDKLPFPAYHLVDLERYFDLSIRGIGTRPADPFERPRRDISIITSRGCPFDCIFCSIHGSMGKRWRANSPEYVLRHVEYLVRTYRVELFHFEDDNLTFNRRRLQDILGGLVPLPLEWDMPNGIRADTLDRETLALMKRAHVKEIRIAIESGSQRVLDQVIHKHLDLARAIQVCRECHSLGIPLSSFYVIGLPGETRREMDATLDLAARLMNAYGVFPHVNIANPLEGTPLFEVCRQGGYLVDDGVQDATLPYRGKISTEEFSASEIERAFSRFHRRLAFLYGLEFLKKPGRTLRQVRNVVTHPGLTLGLVRAVLQLMK